MRKSDIFSQQIVSLFPKMVVNVLVRALSNRNPRAFLRQFRMLWNAFRFQQNQLKKRMKAENAGQVVPPVLIVSVTRKCNLDCTDCYSKKLRKKETSELSDAAFLDLFQEAAELGVGIILIVGGEPLLRRDLIKKASMIPGIVMPLFTNGTLLDDEVFPLFENGRLIPILSQEGDEVFTSARRGDKVHSTVREKAFLFRKKGILFGFSITLTSKNIDLVLSEDYLRSLRDVGAAVLFLVEFVPVSESAGDLILSDLQRKELYKPGRFGKTGLTVITLPGDEEMYGGCLAAGRGFVHISDSGRLEACPFAPFSDSDVTNGGLAKALNSPLMRKIREKHHELVETKGGCALWNQKGWISGLGCGWEAE